MRSSAERSLKKIQTNFGNEELNKLNKKYRGFNNKLIRQKKDYLELKADLLKYLSGPKDRKRNEDGLPDFGTPSNKGDEEEWKAMENPFNEIVAENFPNHEKNRDTQEPGEHGTLLETVSVSTNDPVKPATNPRHWSMCVTKANVTSTPIVAPAGLLGQRPEMGWVWLRLPKPEGRAGGPHG